MSSPPFPPLPLPLGITESYLPSHDLTYHVLSAGVPSKPLLLCLHGFPELAFSWRKIMPQLASDGYHVVAYDQRGYGRTTGWDTRPFDQVDLNTFSFTRLVRDAVILVNALGYRSVACILGHDFGAVVASIIIIMSHPFSGSPSLPFATTSPAYNSPPPKPSIHSALANLPEPRQHYKWYYSSPRAASEMDDTPKADASSLPPFLRAYFHLKSADWPGNQPQPLQSRSAPELAKLPYYYIMPLHSSMRDAVSLSMRHEPPELVREKSARWLLDSDLAVYVAEFSRSGFQGGLNYYRILTTEVEGEGAVHMKDVEAFAGKKIDVPMLFIAGAKDWGMYQEPGVLESMADTCERGCFKGVQIVDGAGHWVQQEQAERVGEIVGRFLWECKVERVSM
ncbi:Epoxide hydrolase A [Lachnellula hyalina]|uniref:Epoxide hydrolase A n=1 Tax=Lachnellula hyalina TaxID=1316788 RepID=A0A8H8U1Q9_9HELO|nr:Epoxide hydrolase A [Lachnellula hyalina]TVY28570.1 Epoxide hydrolase A [Lachnellula hyalina]